MQNLIYLIRKFSYIFLFLFCEVIAFVLIIRRNNFQKVTIVNSTQELTGTLYGMFTGGKEYFYLKQENDLLAEENARLRAELMMSKKKYYQGMKSGDTLLGQAFNYIPCKVVKNSVNETTNYFTVDAGSNYGMRKGMGILSPSGIAGVVVGVSPNFAICMSLLNTYQKTKFKVAVELSHSAEFGFLDWDAKSPRFSIVNNIPSYVDVSVGDTVVTSGYSSIFPEGVPVGMVESYSVNPDDGNYVIRVFLATNFQAMRHVYAVDNLYYDELKALDSLKVNQ